MASPSPAISAPSCSYLLLSVPSYRGSKVKKGTVQLALFKGKPSRLHSTLLGHVWTCPISSFSVKSSRSGPFNEPPEFKTLLNDAVKKLCELFPDSIKTFPWTKAESAAMQQLLVLGQEILKWSVSTLFILSSVSDVLFSIARNKELLIPCGLFFGCMAANFLKETSQEFFQNSTERTNLLGIAGFFVLVKIIAMYLSDQQGFLLHAANGGLLQVLWHWNIVSKAGEDRITAAAR